jgi:two-component system, sensor histidine kinase and response regulator
MKNSKINVLIIDDEVPTLTSFKAHFRSFYNVFTANNTVEAKEILEKNEIHVVLCDYNMPNKDGILFFSELLLTHPDITRILITAYDTLDIAIEGINIGSIYRYVHKPWDLNDLKITIDQSYDFHRMKKENELLLDRLSSNERLIALLENKNRS